MKTLILILAIWCIMPFGLAAQEVAVQVNLKSGAVVNARSAFIENFPRQGAAFLKTQNGKERILFADDVVSMVLPDAGRIFVPIQLGNNYRFVERLAHSEKISLYNIRVSTSPFFYNKQKISYLRYAKPGSSLQNLSVQNLRRDLADNENSMKQVRKARLLSTARFILTATGIVFLGLGVRNAYDSLFTPGSDGGSGIGTAGLVLVAVPFFLKKPKQNHLIKAVNVYQ